MSVRRIMGIETEYGISVPGHPTMNAMVTSSQIINSYARLTGLDSNAHWDFDTESPLRDARGYDMSRSDAHSSQLTDDPEHDLGLANLILTNGARLYVDHAHPEYSSPEVTNPRDAVLWDRAGTVIMQRAADNGPNFDGQKIRLYKNNTDNKGASYGCHENYLMSRATPFAHIVKILTPFFVTRQIFTGSGRVGLGQEGTVSGFQISQRADFFEVEVGLETTLKRPIINTRDEPHADPEKYRRLHVIVGDANLSDVATLLKLGTTSLVLSMIEAGIDFNGSIELKNPVASMTQVSYDTSLQQRLEMANGEKLRALDIQYLFLTKAKEFLGDQSRWDADTLEIIELWQETLDKLSTNPLSCSTTVDWIAKLSVIRQFMERDSLDWDHPRLELIDLQYSEIDPRKGIALALERRGALDRLFTDAELAQAVEYPPDDTRAYFRGECIRRYPGFIAAASWDSVVFDTGESSLLRVPIMEPLRGNRDTLESLFDSHQTVGALLDSLRVNN